MKIESTWHSTTGPATAQALVKRLAESIPGYDLALFARREGIPSLTLSRERLPLTIAEVIRSARLLRDAAQCPVHFLQLGAHEVIFLVYHPCLRDGAYTHAQLKNFGVPLTDWLPNILRDGPILENATS